jgi:hypothetical protein
MRLTELDPKFYRYEDRFEGIPYIAPAGGNFGDPYQHTVRVPVEALEQAQCVWLLCPKCFLKNGGEVGTHGCEVTFEGRGVLDSQGSHNNQGKPTRWTVSGTGFDDLTTTPSVLLQGGCNWHGFITNGEVSVI